MNISPYIYAGLETSQTIKPSELLDKAMKLICSQKGINEQDVMGKSRLHSLVMSRHQFCYIARKKTNLSLGFVGALINRDHATVIHSCKTFQNLLDTDIYTREQHFKIMQQLNFKIN